MNRAIERALHQIEPPEATVASLTTHVKFGWASEGTLDYRDGKLVIADSADLHETPEGGRYPVGVRIGDGGYVTVSVPFGYFEGGMDVNYSGQSWKTIGKVIERGPGGRHGRIIYTNASGPHEYSGYVPIGPVSEQARCVE